MKRVFMYSLLLLCALLLAGCSASSTLENYVQTTPVGAVDIPALPDENAGSVLNATLYFRYEDTALLRQEMRAVALSPNETRERALVEALLAGSLEGGALFPEGVEVLSTLTQNGVVFVTFNEALYGRYGDESSALTDNSLRAEAQLRREMAMAALTATLTENVDCHAVQVLVRPQSEIGSSMRLKESYFLRESDQPAALLTRREAYLMTPFNVSRSLLEIWKQRSFDTLYPFLDSADASSARSLPGTLAKTLSAADVLLSYALTPGSASPDGQSAVVCADLTLRRADGSEYTVTAWPVRLMRENGAFKVSMSALQKLMQLSEE